MYRLGIWLIALALVFNGVAMTVWDGPAHASVPIAQGHHAGSGDADCNGLPNDAAAVVKHSGQSHDRTHNHLKCCGVCTVASLVPAFAVMPVAFNVRSAAFSTVQNRLVGHLVFLDPDIPKSIV